MVIKLPDYDFFSYYNLSICTLYMSLLYYSHYTPLFFYNSTMNTPTQAQRNKIDSAIDKVATLCAEDPTITPSGAIAKIASDMSLTPDYLPIIVRAYNTGAAAVHRENADTLQEKVASYPIADIDEVYRILKENFPLNKKAETTPKKDDFWKHNADYYWPNAWDYLKKKPDFSDWKRPPVKMAKCTDYKDSLERNADDTIHMIADEATRIKVAAQHKREQALERVEYELCKYAGVDLDDARRYADLAYGKEGVDVINQIIKDNHLEKKARIKSFLDDEHPFAKAFEEFVNNNEQLKKASAEEREILEACVEALNPTVRPRDRYTEGMSEIDAMFKAGEDNRKKKIIKKAYTPLSADPHSGMTGLEMINHPGWKGLDRFERELMYSLADPAHEAKLRNIHVQTLLADLLNTDPYLKDKDPEEVIDAVNEILEVNPDLHRSKAMLRVALRQYMESGGMDIPTLGLLSDYGKEERERRSKEESERSNRASQEASERNRYLDDLLREERENEYRRSRDEVADRQYKEQREDRQKELRDRSRADKARLKAENDRAKADRTSRENIANLDRLQRQTTWQQDYRLNQRKLWDDNYNKRRDRAQRATAEANRQKDEKDRRDQEMKLEQLQRKYDLSLEQWRDFYNPRVTATEYRNKWKIPAGPLPTPTPPDPTIFK